MTKTDELIPAQPRAASSFPADGRRLLIYVVYDRRGEVEDYIPYALRELRRQHQHIIAVVNGKLTAAGRQKLDSVCDEVVERENSGFDIWGYKFGLEQMADRIAEFDEIVLANDTWYGPVRPFDDVFDRMNGQDIHFWGLTDHPRLEPNPFTQTGYLPYHVQSYWIAVRRAMFLSDEWREYWRDLPELPEYADAVVKHEGAFTERFVSLGFSGEVAFPLITDLAMNYPLVAARQLLDAGCPTLKRRPFFEWPTYLDSLGVVGRWTLDTAAHYGYPLDLIYADLARNVEPRVLNADAALVSVLSADEESYDPERPLRTLVIAHIFYPEMVDEMLDRADHLPGRYDLLITTPESDRAQQIRTNLDTRVLRGSVEVRVLESNNGRDQGAFLVGCRDVLLSGDYDLIVKIHSKKTPQSFPTIGEHFKLQQFDNLLYSPGYAANVVALFQRERGLGLAFPPMVHLGHPTLGRAWWANREGFIRLHDELGIRVPVDEDSPLAPFGSMYFARPEALRLLAEHPWKYEDFGGHEAYQDGGLAHILERMPVYAAAELGYHSRTIAAPEYMSVSHSMMSYNFDQMSATIPGSSMEQVNLIKRLGKMGTVRAVDFVAMYLYSRRPGSEQALLRAYERTTRVRGALWRLRHPAHWRKR
ncbi:rhamnan synthesis F family protein [Microbacterium sp.]|uniref:rhamnan synthesis F family protein n=2 Tax=Microbacterium sp. TaxID=51671 RepID=UPI0032216685